ncbi:MAG: hypothetical protein ACHQ50_02785 [Fimbriimonadales bacterium]
MPRGVPVGLALTVLATSALAHHGRRFLFVTEFHLPHPGQIYAMSDFTGSRFKGGASSLELEPGLLVALGDKSRYAIELHSHIEKEDAGAWSYAATGFELRGRIGSDSTGWNFAGGVEVEAPAHTGPTPVTGEFIAGREDAKGIFMLNLLANNEAGLNGKISWLYRAGYSPNLPGPIGWSLEAQGAVNREASHEIALGAAMSFGESKLLKFGLGKGIGPGSADFIVHLGLVFRLG